MTPVNVARVHFILSRRPVQMSIYVFFARQFSSSVPTDSSLTAAFSHRVRSGEPVSRRRRRRHTVLPITKLTTVTEYLLHLICSQTVSPVEPMLMDMTGGG